MSIHAILLVPERGDPHKLLGDPDSTAWKCGARPPTLMAYRTRTWDKPNQKWIWHDIVEWSTHPGGFMERRHRDGTSFTIYAKNERALVLARDGKPICAGMDHLQRAFGPNSIRFVEAAVLDILHSGWDGEHELHRALPRNYGTLLRVDANWQVIPA